MVTVNETLLREILERLVRLETLSVETNRRIDETNQRIVETNQRIVETNQRIVESNQATNQRLDRQEGRTDKVFWAIVGFGTAIFAVMVAGQFFN